MNGTLKNFRGKVAIASFIGVALVGLTAWRAPHSSGKFAGTLPSPVSEMSPAAFRELTASLTWTGGTDVDRRCTGSADCDAGIAHTSVRIDATPDARFVGAQTADVNGVVVARVKNTGQAVARMYGFKPGQFEYYFIVYGNQSGPAEWSLEEVDLAGGFAHKSVASGSLKGCGHAPASVSKASFQTCDHASAGVVKAITSAEDPGWISCTDGCCTLGVGTDK